MGAGRFVIQAEAMGTGMQRGADTSSLPHRRRKTLAVFNRCCCHPVQWGLKKGLRRGRRRLDKLVIKAEIEGP